MTITYHIDEIDEVAARVLAFAKAKCIIFNAPMGSGKTTLIKALCKKLGVTEDISSPTYSIVNEYKGSGCSIYHFDLYRIKELSELYAIGIEEYLDSDHYVFIEWPELVLHLLEKHLTVTIKAPYLEKRTLSLGNN